MKTAPFMQSYVARLAQSHGFDLERMSHDRLELRLPHPNNELLSIRSMFLSEVTVSMSHQAGNKIKVDRLVTFHTGEENWIPVHFYDEDGLDHIYGEVDEFEGCLVPRGDAEGQARLASDCEEWAARLEMQGWLELAER